MQLQAVQIERFKAIADAPFDLGPLVGANNSGKSSIIQGLHFGVGLLQTIELAGLWPKG
jgi:predicted ATP-dependent endonuclease of OLD family